MRLSELRSALALIRDFSRAPGERAIAATLLASGESTREPGDEPLEVDPAQRMFGYDVAHDDALPWDGKSTRSGTITLVEDDRIEQYVGRSSWIAYDVQVFGGTMPRIGDQLRIARRKGSVDIECIGQNRFNAGGKAVQFAASGMAVVRRTPLDEGELEQAAQAVAERYSATLESTPHCLTLHFAGAASLAVTSSPDQTDETAIRLNVHVRSDRPNEACDAERAMILFAALLTIDEASAVLDDTGAHFTGDTVYELARKNAMRADSFVFASAAAQRTFPVANHRVFDDASDELTVFSTQASRTDFAFATLGRALQAFVDVAQTCADPVIPQFIEGVPPEHRGAPGDVQPLAQLAYQTLEIGIAFVDADAATGALAERITKRADVEALLGAPIRSAVIFAVRSSAEDPDPGLTALESRRADAMVTALGAIFTHDTPAIASDAGGVLYCAADLSALALRRQGKTASLKIRA